MAIEDALKIIGHLVGFLDDTGGINWVWFSDPKAQILGKTGDTTDGLPYHADYLGQLVRSIKNSSDGSGTDDTFTDGYSWVPLNDDKVKVGFVWSSNAKTTGSLDLGFGAKADFPAGSQQIDLSVLAKLLNIDAKANDAGYGKIKPLIPDFLFSGGFPAPDFLKALGLSGEISLAKQTVSIDVTNKAGSGDDAKRSLVFPFANPTNFAWDCVRVALFVVEAWIHDKATGNTTDTPFTRIDKHLFPMFGEPTTVNGAANPIGEFPLFGKANMTKPVDGTTIGPWRDSVLSFSNNGAAALAFLWHLRALLTGNENQNFLTASLFMPLVSGAWVGAGATPPTMGPIQNYDPKTINTAGAYIGITNSGTDFTLVLDVVAGNHVGTDQNYVRIPLAALSGGQLVRPPKPAVDPTPFFATLPAVAGIKVSKPGTSWQISFQITLNGTGTFLDGDYEFDAILDATVRFQVSSPKLPLTLALPPSSAPAPPDPKQVLTSLITWVVSAIPVGGSPTDPATKLGKIAQDLGAFITAEIKTPGSGNIGNLLLSIGKALADGLTFDLNKQFGLTQPFDLTVALSQGNTPSDKFFHIAPGVSYGPINVDQLPNFPISIGKLEAGVDLAVDHPGNPLWGFSLGLDDLRLGDASGNASGLIASLLPNLKNAPGFTFAFAWSPSKGVQISGGGKIPVQLTLGPLSLQQLLVDASNSALTIGVDLTFQLSVITVSVYDLSFGFDFKSKKPTFGLKGLALSMDAGGIKLSGLFLSNDLGGGVTDYIGGASVDIEDMFSLSAIGGYAQLASGQPSMFIFASLVAPLGGPPYFFITGIAGGFGYNRMLPPMTLMSKHPFIKIMNGDIPITGDPQSDLTQLDKPGTGFAVKEGDYWIAAGIQFTSFGFIDGKVLVAVAFGHDFSFNLLGIASFGLSPVAYFEIDILVTVDQEKFLLIAGVSPNSYILNPDIFSLSGDFGLGVWHSGPHAGDFMLSIGGFHPYFKKPDYYPDLARVSVKATIYSFIHVDIECFFACTPQALMAGASVSLSATFAGIGAGLDVYVDVFIQWDPFFILADMGVTVWFEFLGRHEIGVDLQIHTPPLGGIATIHLFIVSFDISFGSDLNQPPPPPLFDFITNRLNVPAKTWNALGTGAQLALFNSDASAGLIRILFTAGKTTPDKGDNPKAQEGADPTKPVLLSPEFSFLVRTHLPFRESDAALNGAAATTLSGTVNLPLCSMMGLSTSLVLTAKAISGGATVDYTGKIPGKDIARSADFFPAANFGASPLPVAQGGQDSARQAVSSIDTSHASVPLTDGYSFNLTANLNPASQKTMLGPEEQPSPPAETYPLPLGWPPATTPVFVAAKSKYIYAARNAASQADLVKKATQLKPPKIGKRRDMALAAMKPRTSIPWKVLSMAADVNRAVKIAAVVPTSVAAPPAGLAAVTPPASRRVRRRLRR